MFLDFRAKGLAVIPLEGGKPQAEWSRYYEQLPSEKECQKWDNAGYKEYAVLCGAVSGVIALDIDTNDTALFYAIAGETPLRKVGSKGFTAFYRYNGERSQTWGGVVELLSDKRLTTIPPSPHRKTGIPYVWMGESDSFDNLPAINPDFFTFMDAKYPKQSTRAWVTPVEYNDKVELQEAAEMLDYISSDCPRDEWVQVGMALRDEFGDAACHLWHDWSAKAGRRYNHNDAQAAWRSFGGHGVTIGTLVYFAKQGGWLPTRSDSNNSGFSVDISYIFDKKKSDDRPAQVKVSGLVGLIADWITETAISPQPALSLSAALAFVGMLKGGRVCHQIRGARTNLMCISMAPTGSGKDWPQEAIDHLAIELGLDKHLMAKPTSGTALLKGIEKSGGIALLKVDEVGRYMGHITSKNAQSFQSEIGDYIIELFSSSTRTFRGKQYADEKANPSIIIKNPHFCCYGSSVPEKFKQACQSSTVIDGFLNRWLMFSSTTWPDRDFTAKQTISQQVVDAIRYWMASNEIAVDAYGNPTKPKVLSFTPEAFDIFKAFESEQHDLVKSVPHPFNAMYVRSAEQVVKLSLVLCDDDAIGISELNSAIDIVRQSNAHIMDFAKGITDNEHEAKVAYVLDVIKRCGIITREHLTYKTRKLSNRERKEVVEQLIESGEVIAKQDGKKVSLSLPE